MTSESKGFMSAEYAVRHGAGCIVRLLRFALRHRGTIVALWLAALLITIGLMQAFAGYSAPATHPAEPLKAVRLKDCRR